MLVHNESQEYNTVDSLPMVLALNAGGEPLRWINYEQFAFYEAKDKVLWTTGHHEVTLHGGMNSITGKQSTLKMFTIVALDSKKSPTHYRKGTPSLTNRALFERDSHLCAYCGVTHGKSTLTRDHVLPTSKQGKNVWENVVTACDSCNRVKDDRTPEQAGMPLLYVPYAPSFNEHMILMNRKILVDQMKFLLKGVPKHSRLHQTYNDLVS